MKIIFIIALVAIFATLVLFLKNKEQSKIMGDQGTTTGIVLAVFHRGKLPFCKFQYTVESKNYTKTQEIQKTATDKILNQSYTVLYEKSNPSNAIIQLSIKP